MREDFWHAECVSTNARKQQRNEPCKTTRVSSAKELAMRRIMLTLVGLGMFLCGTNVAMARGYTHPAYRHPVAHRHYYPGYAVRYGAGYAPRHVAGYGP